MLYGSETWCLRENETTILKRTEKAMIRAMCGAKFIAKSSQEFIDLLGLKKLRADLPKQTECDGMGTF